MPLMINPEVQRWRIAGKLMGAFGVIATIASLSAEARASAPRISPEAGAEYEITKVVDTLQKSADGFDSDSSHDESALLERVVVTRDGGVELEYDLPRGATAQDRARNWRFPARVFRPSSGALQLLNGPDLEARLDGWLEAAKLTRDACGRMVFTWTAFRIECDPQSVVGVIEAFDLKSVELREGETYHDADARSPGTLTKADARLKGAAFTAEMPVEPDAVRRERAETDVAVAELMRRPVTLEAALLKQAPERISGTITVKLEESGSGDVRRRTRVRKVETIGADGRSKNETVTEVVERRLVSETSSTH